MIDLTHNWNEKPAHSVPVIDFNSCETKGLCTAACPYDVLELSPISDDQVKALSFFARFKTMLNGTEKAYVVNPGLCNGCGLCVSACPERAITLGKA